MIAVPSEDTYSNNILEDYRSLDPPFFYFYFYYPMDSLTYIIT